MSSKKAKKTSEEDDVEEVISIGYRKVSKRPKLYVSYLITTKGDKVIKCQETEPDLRAIAEEATKENFANLFMSPEL